ncbi:RING-type domain-containing protein [Plasmodiophora brassicae]
MAAPGGKRRRRRTDDAAGAAPAKTGRGRAKKLRVDEGRTEPVPTTIDMQTNEAIALPEMPFASSAFGERAAHLDPDALVGRLAGSLRMRITPSSDVLSLYATVRASKRRLRSGTIRWNADGDVGSGGKHVLTVAKLLDAVDNDAIRATYAGDDDDARGRHLLWCLCSLTTPERDVYNAPLIRVLINRVDGAESEYEFHVYFTRLVFYLIAFDPLKTVMEALTAPATFVVDPLHKWPTYDACFKSTTSTTDPFTLPALLAAHEDQGYAMTEQPPGLDMQMMDYQLQTLRWMQDRETIPRGLNSMFWEKRRWSDVSGGDADADTFYYMPSTGELRLEAPAVVRGGLLCEEMGLGKTLEVVALILWSKLKDRGASVARNYPGARLYKSSATLIVVPAPLVSQWETEIIKYVQPGVLSVFVHSERIHGRCTVDGKRECPPGSSCIGQARHVANRSAALASAADIVITTYKTLLDDACLQKIAWKRIVLDEMQEIRSSTTELAVACRSLQCDLRWMVSGTPLFSSINDLNGELNFLAVMPFCLNDNDDGFWGARIGRPWAQREPDALKLLHTLLDGIMIRHSKSQTTLSGRALISLPPATKTYVPVSIDDTSNAHVFVVKFVERLAADIFELMRRGRIRLDKSMLGLAKSICIAPALVNGGSGCHHRLNQVDQYLRRLTYAGHRDGDDVNVDVGGAFVRVDDIVVMSADEAMRVLMRTRARTDRDADLVRDASDRQGNYNTGRRYAVRTILDKACEAIGRRRSLQLAERRARSARARCRWRLALEGITSGFYEARCALTSPDESLSLSGKAQAQLKLVRDLVDAEMAVGDNPGAEADYRTVVRAYKDAAPVGWRHRQGDRIWEGRILASGAVRDDDDAVADFIVARHAELVQAVEAGRARDRDVLLAELGDAVHAYADGRPLKQAHPDDDDASAVRLRFTYKDVELPLAVSPAGEAVGRIKRRLVPMLKSATGHSAHVSRLWLFGPGGVVLEDDEHRLSDDSGTGAFRVWLVPGAPRDAPIRRGLLLDLADHVRELTAEIGSTIGQLDCLLPYVQKLLWATQAGLAAEPADAVVEQSGFASLAEIMEGKAPPCSICYQPVQQPTFTRCVHLACADCICTWVQAAPVFVQERNPLDTEKRTACMLCRQPFCASELIRVRAEAPGPDDTPDKTEADGKAVQEEPLPKPAVGGGERCNEDSQPRFSSVITMEELDCIRVHDSHELVAIRDPRFPAITRKVLVQFAHASGVPAAAKPQQSSRSHRSPKVTRLLELLRRNGKAKTVVFTQHVLAVCHLSCVLAEENVDHVTIVRGDSHADLYAAVRRFSVDEECLVLLLHAGMAAAGLTLTAASHVILLEPFDIAGLEAQALNRCHRIGQTRDVSCEVLYLQGTIEERMLAHRRHESQFDRGGNDSASLAVLASQEDGIGSNHMPSEQKLKFLLGIASYDSAPS